MDSRSVHSAVSPHASLCHALLNLKVTALPGRAGGSPTSNHHPLRGEAMNSLGSEITECRIPRGTLLLLCPPLFLPLCLLGSGRRWLSECSGLGLTDLACLRLGRRSVTNVLGKIFGQPVALGEQAEPGPVHHTLNCGVTITAQGGRVCPNLHGESVSSGA